MASPQNEPFAQKSVNILVLRLKNRLSNWVGYVAPVTEKRNICNIFVKKSEGEIFIIERLMLN
jgi:hypothetical protein